MKKNKLIYGLLAVLSLSVLTVGCDDDEEKASAGFAGIASSYYEGDGDATMTIPFVNGSVSESDITFDGSATLGEDYELVGITDEGVEIKFLEDNDCEGLETLRITISNTSNANNRHTVVLISNENEGVAADFAGDFTVTTDDWADYHAGDELTVEVVDATHLRVVGYPATGVDHVDMVITISDLSSGAVVVESQDNGSYNASGTQQCTTVGAGTINSCDGTIDLTLDFTLPCCGTFSGNHFVLEMN